MCVDFLAQLWSLASGVQIPFSLLHLAIRFWVSFFLSQVRQALFPFSSCAFLAPAVPVSRDHEAPHQPALWIPDSQPTYRAACRR